MIYVILYGNIFKEAVLKKKVGIKELIVVSLNGMAYGLFASLLIGLILKQLGQLTGIEYFLVLGETAQKLMGPAIAVGVSYALKAPALVLISTLTVGAIGAGSIELLEAGASISTGEPVGAYIAVIVAVFFGNLVAGKTRVDILLVPSVTILTGGLAGLLISPIMSQFMNDIGLVINQITHLHPIPMGALISLIMGILLTLPISSAAIAISLNLSGLAAGAATVGTCTHMIGFAVISYQANGPGGFIAQGLGTSMLQMPNIIKKPRIALPVIFTSLILGPISTYVLKMESNSIGAGMGTSGFVGQLAFFDVNGYSTSNFILVFLMHFLIPAVLSYIFYSIFKKRKLVVYSDYKLADIDK